MKLPNGEQAEIAMDKLINYCLNPEHSSGKHKARVFKSRLGITQENAELLLSMIRLAAIEREVVQQAQTEFGQQFKVDWRIPNDEEIQLRTIWEIRSTNSNPRLISAFIR
ncbi:conserved hypothetical protein [Rippkaea orientalis PCC 8801]|uniref:DUF6883 domain-containing protein n=1 Tax=Rippkaea orientalis (strain PCC 8801 / RF-1) TaxID=41431 RepID=B7JVF3_RIPO1|nr:DUF6883 domain-containing protein [Rippkaea orientalis]ACK68286.1 conserved hypothetical protein [Rippkaea orientalis PCC 8801]